MMKIRIPLGVILVSIVLILVIAYSSCSNCQKYVPFSSEMWSNVGKYREGMSVMKPLSYTTYPANANVAGSSMDAYNVANTTTSQGAGPVTSSGGVRLWGFGSDLYSGTDNDKSLDLFGTTPGSSQCFDRSFGLTKSTGPLCTTDAQYRLMTTRGGNATGVSAQIGGR